uniref:Putative secreted protein n=1 Tax=Ixodes ricinus TaxID=34613 RepID=A0A147BFA8_IXORI
MFFFKNRILCVYFYSVCSAGVFFDQIATLSNPIQYPLPPVISKKSGVSNVSLSKRCTEKAKVHPLFCMYLARQGRRHADLKPRVIFHP